MKKTQGLQAPHGATSRHNHKGIDKPRIKITTRIIVLDKIRGDSTKNLREIVLSIGKYTKFNIQDYDFDS